MVDPKSWLVLALVAGVVVASVMVQRIVKMKAERAIGQRSTLEDDEFAARYFINDQRTIAIEARRLLKAYIPVDYRLVHPDDELVKDLQLATIDGLDANQYVRDLSRAFNVKIDDHEAANWRTLKDVVSGVMGCMKANAAKQPSDINCSR